MPTIWLKRYKPLKVLFSFFHCKCISHIQSHLSQCSWLRIHVYTEALFFMLWFLASNGILHQYPFFEFFFFHLFAFMYLKMGFLGGVSTKEPTCQCRRYERCKFNPWIKKMPWRRACKPLQYSCLENPMGRGAWWSMVHKVAKSWTRLKWLSMHTHIHLKKACICF